MATVLDQIAGYFGGGPSRVDAAGGAALLAARVEGIRDSVLANVRSFGAKLGPRWGSQVFRELYEGSREPAAAAVAAEERRLFGVDRQTLLAGGLIGAVVVIALLVARGRR